MTRRTQLMKGTPGHDRTVAALHGLVCEPVQVPISQDDIFVDDQDDVESLFMCPEDPLVPAFRQTPIDSVVAIDHVGAGGKSLQTWIFSGILECRITRETSRGECLPRRRQQACRTPGRL